MVGNQQARASQRLSSGYRINSAADDAAGLGISEKMRSQIRGLNQASRNAQDGISLIQTAEGAMQTVNEMVARIRELVIQAANDTNAHDDTSVASWSQSDRRLIQDEINQLMLEIDSVTLRTEFNTRKLLDGSLSGSAVGLSAETKALIDEFNQYNSVVVGQFNDSIQGLADSQAALASAQANQMAVMQLENRINNMTTATALQSMMDELGAKWLAHIAANTTADAGSEAQGSWLANEINEYFGITAATTIISQANVIGIANFATTGINNLTGVAIAANNAVYDGIRNALAEVMLDALSLHDLAGNTLTAATYGDLGDLYGASGVITTDISDANDSIGDMQSSIASLNGTLSNQLANNTALRELGFTDYQEMMAAYDAEPGNALWFQIGANREQGVRLAIEAVNVRQLSLVGDGDPNVESGFTFADLWTGRVDANGGLVADSQDNTITAREQGVMKTSGADIQKFVTALDFALSHVLTQRSNLGAMQNRLEFTIQNLDIASENMSAAESRIRDADMAQEMMRLTQANVLQQAATAMLAQANQAPQSILQLLG
jgi:flagellin